LFRDRLQTSECLVPPFLLRDPSSGLVLPDTLSRLQVSTWPGAGRHSASACGVTSHCREAALAVFGLNLRSQTTGKGQERVKGRKGSVEGDPTSGQWPDTQLKARDLYEPHSPEGAAFLEAHTGTCMRHSVGLPPCLSPSSVISSSGCSKPTEKTAGFCWLESGLTRKSLPGRMG
jgi:hypothetical protein